MVRTDTGNTSDISEHLELPHELLVTVESEEEEGADLPSQYEGYQPLATAEDEANTDHISSDISTSTPQSSTPDEHCVVESFPPTEEISSTLVQEVWSMPTPEAVEIEMDSKKVDEVKEAMAGFTLPSSSIPEWAMNIPEEVWKEKLINQLGNK